MLERALSVPRSRHPLQVWREAHWRENKETEQYHAVVSTTREKMESAIRILGEVTSEWGLTVSVSKTKLMIAGISSEDTNQQPLTIGGEEIETVSAFRYLGAIVEGNGNITSDVESRVAKASST